MVNEDHYLEKLITNFAWFHTILIPAKVLRPLVL